MNKVSDQGPAHHDIPWSEPTRGAAAWHSLKRSGHVLLRWVRDGFGGPRRIPEAHQLTEAPLVAEHRSPLWLDGREDEFILRCGKVENLRVAVRSFDGVEVKAGQVLSFWSQVGRPSALRGYVKGREIMNGCVVPTLGGGLCQLSNALATLATRAGVRLLERHRHSALIEAKAPSLEEDATVAWNYIDLRLVADFDFRIEALLTADELQVSLRAHQPVRAAKPSLTKPIMVREDRPIARGCLTCEQVTCFRHESRALPSSARSARLLHEWSPEFAQWLQAQPGQADWMVPWVPAHRRSLAWPCDRTQFVVAMWASWKRIARQRLALGEGSGRQAVRMQTSADLAQHYARSLKPEHTDLLIAQDLLVPLWRLGVLGGRSFDVWLTELPTSELQARLHAAAQAQPEELSLSDFRVPPQWEQDEWKALRAARRRLTTHADVASVLMAAGLSVDRLPWITPAAPSPHQPVLKHAGQPTTTLTLAASALARKGAREVAAVARQLGARVLILGSPPSDEELWSGIDWRCVGYSSPWLEETDVAVLPAYVEHQPRALLQALAAGVPVVASRACGLDPQAGWVEVEPGDIAALENAVRPWLGSGAASKQLVQTDPIASP